MVLPAETGNNDYIMELESTVAKLTNENLLLRTENEDLKRRLLLYENLHTPPSLQRIKPVEKENHTPKKRGAPLGHRGATRIHGEPDEIIHVSTDVCPKCSHKLGIPVKTEK